MIEDGSTVRIHYTGTLDDGSIFDTSRDKEPLEFTLGENAVIAGMEEAVRDMEVGQHKTVTIPPEKAFGFYDDAKIEVMPMLTVPNPERFSVGVQTHIFTEDGLPLAVKLLEIDDEGNGHFDFNLPLAGKNLTFDIELLGVS